jgi:FlaA1/EpsC-like NDP-sugar epimerase
LDDPTGRDIFEVVRFCGARRGVVRKRVAGTGKVVAVRAVCANISREHVIATYVWRAAMGRKATTTLAAVLCTILVWVVFFFLFPTHPLGASETSVLFLVCLALVALCRWVVSGRSQRKEKEDDKP